MKKTMNLIGRVGKNPESFTTATGVTFASFSVALEVGTKDQPRTEWVKANAYGKTRDHCLNYVKSGMLVSIDGTPWASAYLNKEGKAIAVQNINIGEILFLSNPNKTVANNESTSVESTDIATPENLSSDNIDSNTPDVLVDDVPEF